MLPRRASTTPRCWPRCGSHALGDSPWGGSGGGTDGAAGRRAPRAAPAQRASLWSGIADGLAYLRADPRLRGLLLLTAVLTIVGFPYAMLMPVLAREALGLDAAGYGRLMDAIGVGAFLGAVGVAGGGPSVLPGWPI